MRFLVLLFSLYFTAGAATSRANGGRLGMYDGTATTIEKHPYMVRIYGEGYFWCAGTIVSESWVVTSGACTELASNLPANLQVVAGSNGSEGDGTTYAVSQVVQHPQYDNDDYDYSYSCIQVDGTFTWGDTMQPLSLPSKDFSTGTWYTVAGWGALDVDGDTYTSMREGRMKWMPKLYCDILYAIEGWFLTDRQGCAYNRKKTTLCTGDIGDSFTLDGIYYGHFIYPSWVGDVCDSTSKAVLVAKVYPVVNWIQNITGATIA